MSWPTVPFVDSPSTSTPLSAAGLNSRFAELGVAIDADTARHIPFYNVKDAAYGAVGDGGTDDRAAIQAAIDAANAAGGGVVYFPTGRYKVNAALILKAQVTLSSGRTYPGAFALGSRNAVEIMCTTVGAWTIDTAGVSNTYGMGIIGIDVYGANTGFGGIRFQKARYSTIRGVSAVGYTDQGILLDSSCLACTLDTVNTVNCVQTTARAAVIGGVEIDGTDHFLSRIEASSYPGATSGPIDSTNFWITGILLKGSSCSAFGCIGENSDYGWRVSGNENRFVGCRGDTNWAGDWIVSGVRNTFSSCIGAASARAANNTYDSWIVGLYPNTFSGCTVQNASTGRTYRYGFNDTVGGTISQRNRYVGCSALNCATLTFKHTNNQFSGGYDVARLPIHPVDTTALPDVTGTSFLVLDLYATATTINGFINGVGAQELTVLPTTANVTLAHNARAGSDGNLLLSTQANKLLVSKRVYRFQRYLDQWYEIPDPHVLTGSTTWDPGSLLTGATERKSVTVTGAAVGDPATAGLSVIAATGWDIQAAVIAANTVEVKITNNTAGTVDLGSGTVRASVIKVT